MERKETNYFYLLLIIVPFFAFVKGPHYPLDLWNWVQSGKLMMEQGTFLPDFIFTFSETVKVGFSNSFIAIIYYSIHKFTGDIGLVTFHHLLLIPILLLAYDRTIKERCYNLTTASRFMLYLITFGVIVSSSERPGFISLIPFLINFNFFIKEKLKKRDYIFILLNFILWVNLHGSFLLFFVLWGCRLIIHTLRKQKTGIFEIGLVLFLACLLTGVNPFGLKLLEYHFNNINISKLRVMEEYRSILLQPIGILFALLFGQIVYLLWKAKLSFSKYLNLLPYVVLILATLQSGRVLVYMVFSLPFLLKEYSLLGSAHRQSRNKNEKFFVFITCVLTIILFHPLKKRLFPKMRLWSEGGIPKIVNFLEKDKRSCHIFNDWKYGSHLSILERKIAIDGRNVIYTQQAYNNYLKVIKGRLSRSYFRKNNICYAVLDKRKSKALINKIGGKIVLNEHEAVLVDLYK